MAKSHEHIVRVLLTLNGNVDNKRPDEPSTLKEVMSKHDLPE